MEFLTRLAQDTTTGSTPDVTCENFPPACFTNISGVIDFILPVLFLLAAVVLLGVLIFAAFKMMTSDGEADNFKTIKNTITYAVIGVLVIVLAYFLVRVIAFALGIPFLL